MDSSNATTNVQAPLTSTFLQPENLGAPGQSGPTTGISSDAVVDLLKAASTGHFWDVLKQLSDTNAAQLRELKRMLQKMVPDQDPAETDPDKDESVQEKIVMSLRRSSGDASSSSESASDTDSLPNTDKKKKDCPSLSGDKDLLGQDEDDVLVLDNQSGGEGKEDDHVIGPPEARMLKGNG